MSYFLAGALVTAAFALLHTASMVVAFDGLEAGRRERWACVPAAHLAAAALVRAASLCPVYLHSAHQLLFARWEIISLERFAAGSCCLDRLRQQVVSGLWQCGMHAC